MMKPLLCSLFLTSWLAVPAFSQTDFEWIQGGEPFGVHVHNSQEVWVAEDGGRIRYSSDGGQTWSQAQTPDDVRCQLRGIQIIEDNNGFRVGWCCGEEGVVLRSRDGGYTWTKRATVPQIYNPTEPADLHQLHFFSARKGWVVGDNAVIKITNDAGVSWQDPPSSPPTINFFHGKDIYDIHFLDNQRVVLVMDYGTIAVSLDAGVTWLPDTIFTPSDVCPPPNNPVPPIGELELWSVDFIGDKGVVVGGFGTNDGYFFRSEDGGLSWTQEACVIRNATFGPTVTVPTQYGVTLLDPDTALSTGYGSSIFRRAIVDAIDPEDDDGPCASCPAGSWGWEQLDPVVVDEPSAPHNWIDSFGTSDAFLTGRFGKIQETNNAGTNWVDRGEEKGGRTLTGTFANLLEGCLASQALEIRCTTDGGANFTVVNDFDLANQAQFFLSMAYNPAGDRAIAGATGSIAYRLNPSGNWVEAFPGGGASYFGATYTPSGQKAFLVGSGGVIRFTTNDGVSWSNGDPQNDIPSNVILRDVAFVDDLTGFAVGGEVGTGEAKAYSTTDGGSSWQLMTINGQTNFIAFYGVDASGTEVFGVGDLGKILKVDPLTGVWEHVAPGLLVVDEKLNDVGIVPTTGELYIVGDQGRALYFDGNTWIDANSKTSQNLVQLSVFAGNQGFVVGQKFGLISFQ